MLSVKKMMLFRIFLIIYFLLTFVNIVSKETAERDLLDIFLLIVSTALVLESAFQLSKILRSNS
jgi:heme/copper-type cytochrome/quinol oxidase subunit 3